MPVLKEHLPPTEPTDARPHPGRRLTEAEFLAWIDEDTRAEWVDGEVIMMAPVSIDHDQFFGWLRTLLTLYVEHHDLGSVFGTEVLVRLPRLRRLRMPDLVFVSKARAGIVGRTRINGVPDLIMELVSPESVSRDWRDKHIEYEKAGVKEYWVIDRPGGRMEAHALSRDGKYRQIDEQQGRVRSLVLKGFHLRTEWALGDSRPRAGAVLKELGVRL
jgi:Uma2 family endonuclease